MIRFPRGEESPADLQGGEIGCLMTDGTADPQLPITVLLAAKNEEANLPKCLAYFDAG